MYNYIIYVDGGTFEAVLELTYATILSMHAQLCINTFCTAACFIMLKILLYSLYETMQ